MLSLDWLGGARGDAPSSCSSSHVSGPPPARLTPTRESKGLGGGALVLCAEKESSRRIPEKKQTETKRKARLYLCILYSPSIGLSRGVPFLRLSPSSATSLQVFSFFKKKNFSPSTPGWRECETGQVAFFIYFF